MAETLAPANGKQNNSKAPRRSRRYLCVQCAGQTREFTEESVVSAALASHSRSWCVGRSWYAYSSNLRMESRGTLQCEEPTKDFVEKTLESISRKHHFDETLPFTLLIPVVAGDSDRCFEAVFFE